ncbi:uncharacterized protein E0L32_003296 [Thyridium curvatum]|uniref:LicD/FKTN/FKRP nucleotidyltransferase domain-containing protein n=1 Tax=Thyridium curvatum TaxID=1093900 RepID=A0A507BKE4_9PEZI|nr:uncharacterized protein E0L32_003296 [Thyridium curvatum]TPX17178.1 hypothetical protein E0L32_003296 [Thyridium curvatum]
MRLGSLLCLGAFLTEGLAAPLGKRDADFESVRRKQRVNKSGSRGNSQKYFHESTFAEETLPYHEQKEALKNLLQTYLATFSDLGIETWLMHGSLLGWWWNKHIMPWDTDVDVQVTESSMYYMAAYYNMSVFHYRTPRIPDGRDYMLEVNPHFKNREQTDKMNVIDARWIDTSSGLFIDITTARYNLTHPEGEGMMSCKDGHEFRDTYIFPLRETVFEGSPAKIPYRYKEILQAEYSAKSLYNKDFHDHLFDDAKMDWVPKIKQVTPEEEEAEKKEAERRKKWEQAGKDRQKKLDALKKAEEEEKQKNAAHRADVHEAHQAADGKPAGDKSPGDTAAQSPPAQKDAAAAADNRDAKAGGPVEPAKTAAEKPADASARSPETKEEAAVPPPKDSNNAPQQPEKKDAEQANKDAKAESIAAALAPVKKPAMGSTKPFVLANAEAKIEAEAAKKAQKVQQQEEKRRAGELKLEEAAFRREADHHRVVAKLKDS